MGKKFKTINNMPNSKWWASTITAIATIVVAMLTNVFGIDIEAENVEQAMFGLVTFVVVLMQVVGYFKRPGEDDGIKEDKPS